jgi:hypothetical protein
MQGLFGSDCGPDATCGGCSRATAKNELEGQRQADAKLGEVSSQLSAITVKFHDQELAVGESEKEGRGLVQK